MIVLLVCVTIINSNYTHRSSIFQQVMSNFKPQSMAYKKLYVAGKTVKEGKTQEVIVISIS